MPFDHLHAPPRLLEVAHVAHRLSVSLEFVRRLIRTQQLKALRIGRRWRVSEADLQAWMDAQQTPVPGETPEVRRGREAPRPMPHVPQNRGA